MSGESMETRIYTKLAKSASGTELEVRAQADLDEASVIGSVVEAYVIAVGRSGFQVDMWRAEGRGPFKIERFGEHGAAVVAAVVAARGKRRKAKQAVDS